MYLKKKEVIDKIFYIVVTVYFLFSAMTVTMVERIEIIQLLAKMARYVCYVAFLFIIACNVINFNQKLSLKSMIKDFIEYFREHLLLLVILVNTVLILLSAKATGALVLVLLVWACSFYDFKKILKLYFVEMVGFMLFTWALSFLEIVPEIVIMREGRQRFSLGFIYPLETMTFYLFLVICYIYLKNKKYGIKDLAFINVIAYLIYAVTEARTSYYLVVGSSVLALIYAKTNVEKVLKKIPPAFYYVMMTVAILGILACGYFYTPTNEILFKLNDLLSTRLELMNRAFHNYGFTLFGESIKWVGFGGNIDPASVEAIYNFVDCAYAKMLLDYGIIFSIFVCMGYGFMYQYAIKQQDYGLILVVTIVLVVSVMEPRLVSIAMNPFVLLLGQFFLMKNRSRFKFIA